MSTIRIDVNHVGLGMEFTQLAFNCEITLKMLKDKLYPKTGTEPLHAVLCATSSSQGGARDLVDDDATLESLGICNGDKLEMRDTNETSEANTLDLTSAAATIEKVKAPRGDSGFANFRKKAASATPNENTDKNEAAALAIGFRVKTSAGSLGTIRFLGRCDALPAGYWAGIELDAPTGKNDGEVKGVRLFTCAAMHGGVMRPSTLTTIVTDEVATSDEGHVFEKVSSEVARAEEL